MQYISSLQKLCLLTDRTRIEESFFAIAHALLNETTLQINKSDYQICEIEFYLNSPAFKDPFIHNHDRQKTNGEWYFHRKGEDGHPAPNRNGLDLTAGGLDSWCGILIRRIKPIDGEAIDGPSNLVSHLLNQFGKLEARELVPLLENSAFQENSQLRLIQSSNLGKRVVSSPRFGLRYSEKSRDKKLPFVGRHYRYQVDPFETNKGRYTVFLALLEQGVSIEEAARIVKITSRKASLYQSYYEKGKGAPAPTEFKKLSVELECALMGSLRHTP